MKTSLTFRKLDDQANSVNKVEIGEKDILASIKNDERFALTGSRFFEEYSWSLFSNHCLTPETDYDFFAAYSESLVNELKSMGFKSIYKSHSEYEDKDVEQVMRREIKSDEEGDILTPQIDVQLVKNFQVRLVVRNLLAKTVRMNEVPKIYRSGIWDAAYVAMLLPSPYANRELEIRTRN